MECLHEFLDKLTKSIFGPLVLDLRMWEKKKQMQNTLKY